MPVAIRMTSGVALVLGHDIAALEQAFRRIILGAVERRHRLAREDQHAGRLLRVERGLPGIGRLVGVARADRVEPGHGAQRGELLDRLVRRAVLADADRVVREHEDRRHLHDRREPQRRAHIVRKDEEGAGVGAQIGERHAVGGGAHAMLANAEMHVAAVVAARLERAGVLDVGLGRGREIGGAADQPGDGGRDRVQAPCRSPRGWPCPSRRRRNAGARPPSPRAVRPRASCRVPCRDRGYCAR